MSDTIRLECLGHLESGRQLVESRVRANGEYDGWSGKDVLTHLGAYARLIAAILRAEAESRSATDAELYGRELTAEERSLVDLDDVNEAVRGQYAALSYEEAWSFWRTMHADVASQLARLSDQQLTAHGPVHPDQWSRPRLVGVVEALINHYHGHLTGRS